ncbi:MAG TPA: hypothetical protein VHA34_19705 [Actinomycetes bacterium]|nr:hypothetical protein [Actinomycetes bacterium]
MAHGFTDTTEPLPVERAGELGGDVGAVDPGGAGVTLAAAVVLVVIDDVDVAGAAVVGVRAVVLGATVEPGAAGGAGAVVGKEGVEPTGGASTPPEPLGGGAAG